MTPLTRSLLALALLPVDAAWSQQPSNDREAMAAAAEQAAAEAERAAAEAERALAAAKRAAQAARTAASAARAAAGGRPADLAQTQLSARTPQELDPNENLLVTRREEQQAFASSVAASVANGPNDSALKSTPVPDIQLLASSKDKVASLAWTMDISGQPADGTLSAEQLTFTASGKLNDSGEAQILGLDGFPNGSEFKLAYARYASAVNLTGLEKPQVTRARQNCLAAGGTVDSCNPNKFATGVSSFVAKYNPRELRALLEEVLPGPVIFYGVGLSGNQASFKYLDRASFTLKKADHFGFGGHLFGGLLLGAGQTAIIGSFDYRRAFKENDPVTICQPIAGTDQTQCLTSADGAPKKNSQSVLGLELRHAFPAEIGSFASFAVAPKFSIDLEGNAYSLAVPIYFAGDGAGKLRGGIRGVYLSKEASDGSREEDLTLGLFVGVPFSLFRD